MPAGTAMNRPPVRHDRLIALFLLAVVLFSPWLLRVVGAGEILGWPVLYLYLFGAWGIVILLLGLHLERRSRRDGAEEG